MQFEFKTYLRFSLILCAAFLAASTSAIGQDAAPAATALTQASAQLQPVLLDVAHALSSLNISHWKAPGAVRSASQGDAYSIQRDLNGTLPSLIAASNATPASVSAAFAVYRNVDALYDVLLRLGQTAELAAPRDEAGNLQYALTRLEAGRKSMGDAIFTSAQDHDAQLARLQRAIKAAAVAEQRKPVPTTVIDDGPVPVHHHTSKRRRKKRASKPAPTNQTNPAPQH